VISSRFSVHALSKRCGFKLREMRSISRSKNSLEFLLQEIAGLKPRNLLRNFLFQKLAKCEERKAPHFSAGIAPSSKFLLHNVLLAMHTPSPHRTCGFQLHTFWQRGEHHFLGETLSDALPVLGSANIPRHGLGNRNTSPKRRTPYSVRECTYSQGVAASKACSACTRSTLFYMRGVI
jgi:hypothetical protein